MNLSLCTGALLSWDTFGRLTSTHMGRAAEAEVIEVYYELLAVQDAENLNIHGYTDTCAFLGIHAGNMHI